MMLDDSQMDDVREFAENRRWILDDPFLANPEWHRTAVLEFPGILRCNACSAVGESGRCGLGLCWRGARSVPLEGDEEFEKEVRFAELGTMRVESKFVLELPYYLCIQIARDLGSSYVNIFDQFGRRPQGNARLRTGGKADITPALQEGVFQRALNRTKRIGREEPLNPAGKGQKSLPGQDPASLKMLSSGRG